MPPLKQSNIFTLTNQEKISFILHKFCNINEFLILYFWRETALMKPKIKLNFTFIETAR